MDVSVSGAIDQNTNLKKFRKVSVPLAHPGSAYVYCATLGGSTERFTTNDGVRSECLSGL